MFWYVVNNHKQKFRNTYARINGRNSRSKSFAIVTMNFHLRHWLLYPFSKTNRVFSVCGVRNAGILESSNISKHTHPMRCEAMRFKAYFFLFSVHLVWLEAEHKFYPLLGLLGLNSMFVFLQESGTSKVHIAHDRKLVEQHTNGKWVWMYWYSIPNSSRNIVKTITKSATVSISHTYTYIHGGSADPFVFVKEEEKQQKTAHHFVQCKFYVSCVRETEQFSPTQKFI